MTSISTGNLGTTTTTRTYTLTSGAGWLWAAASFSGTPGVTLRIRNAAGVTLAQKYGASPIQVRASVPAGTYTVSIIGTRASYTLHVTRPKP